mmetsp:Transcript_3006/g.5511  ORF Transcript_3006/g.5511 Transcript_3006/m.5511 type:complete len:210 (-) Transcript_3006:792-1421(-)
MQSYTVPIVRQIFKPGFVILHDRLVLLDEVCHIFIHANSQFDRLLHRIVQRVVLGMYILNVGKRLLVFHVADGLRRLILIVCVAIHALIQLFTDEDGFGILLLRIRQGRAQATDQSLQSPIRLPSLLCNRRAQFAIFRSQGFDGRGCLVLLPSDQFQISCEFLHHRRLKGCRFRCPMVISLKLSTLGEEDRVLVYEVADLGDQILGREC